MSRANSINWGRALVAALLLTSLLDTAPAAAARPLSRWGKPHLKQDYAKVHRITEDKIIVLHVRDLKQVRGVIGFTLGRHRSKNGRSHGGMVIYTKCGSRYCLGRVRLRDADKVRAFELVDLLARETTLAFGRGGWFGGRLKEPTRRPRWPVLAVQTEHIANQRQKQFLSLISLKNIKKKQPTTLISFATLSQYLGEQRSPRGRSSRSRSSRRSRPRFKGTSATSVRLFREPNKPPRLEVKERPISTRFNRCRRPEPEAIVYALKDQRFVMQTRTAGLGGCR